MSTFDKCPKCPLCNRCAKLVCMGCLQGGTACDCGRIYPEQQAYLDRYYEGLEEHNRQVAEDLANDHLPVHSDACDCRDCLPEEESLEEEDEPDATSRHSDRTDEGDSALSCLVCGDDTFNGVCETCDPERFNKRAEENTSKD